MDALFDHYAYNEHTWRRRTGERFDATDLEDGMVHWINVNDIDKRETVEEMLGLMDSHRVVRRSILSRGQRPRIDIYPEFIFVVVKMPTYDAVRNHVKNEQVSFLLSGNLLLSFQQRPGDVFDEVRERIGTENALLRKSGADHLLYVLLEAILNNYFVLIEKMDAKLENLEERILRDGSEETLEELHKLRKNMLILKNSVWPLKDVFNTLSREEMDSVHPATRIWFRDSYEHVFHIIDTLSIYREMVSGLFDIYLSNLSNRMNKTMTTLTIFATLFIPLTFLTGIYGMNFRYMPEFGWKGGYPMFWVVTGVTVALMLRYFKNKNII